MKREKIVLRTKQAMADSLKKLLSQKTFSKITISDIIKDCDINRKTFYYHFEDIYALLHWMLEEEAVNVVKHFDLFHEYEDAILFVMDYIEQNKHILNCVYDDSMGHDAMKRFLYNDFIGLTDTIIRDVEKELDVCVDGRFRDFLAEFFANALAGILINWLKDRGRYSRQEVIDHISLIFKKSLPEILKAAK